MKQTAMQDLKEDLILTKSNIKDALLEIKNEEINKACIEVVNLTLNRIIKRIDDELLEMEKDEQKNTFVEGMYKGQELYFGEHKIKLDVNSLNYSLNIAEQYFNETFKSE